MAIEDVSLYEDIIRLSTGPEYGTRKIFECTLIVDDFQLKAVAVNSFVFNRDYSESYGDSIIMEIMVSMGTYNHYIYPQRQKLKALIKTVVTDRTGTPMDVDESTFVEEYRATVLDSEDPSLINQNEDAENIVHGDISNLLVISLQLTSTILETIRQTNLQTIVRDSTLENVIKFILKGDAFTTDSVAKVNGVIVTSSDNTEIYKQIILPPMENIIDLIDWIQMHYGIYNNELGLYLQKKFWHVYPLLQTEKFKENSESITIITLPPFKMSGSEKTFAFKDKHLVILATGEVRQIDNTDAEERNIGNGIRYIRADRVIDDFSTTEGGKTKINIKENVLEYKTHTRADGNNYLPFFKDLASINHRKILSKIARNRSNILIVNWENSEPDLLLPGMRVRYFYRENNEVREITGTLINVLHRYASLSKGILETVHSSVSELTITLESNSS